MKAGWGYLMVIMAGCAWGSLGIVGKLLFAGGFEPLSAVWFRIAISFAALLIIMLLFKRAELRVKIKDLLFFALFGLICVSTFNVVYFYTVNLTTVSTAAILLYTAPAFVVVLSRYIFGEFITSRKLISLLLSMLGCFFVVKGYDPTAVKLNLPGILCGLLSGLTYALYTIFAKKSLNKYSPWTVILYTQCFGLLFLSLVNSPLALLSGRYSLTTWGELVFLGLISTLFAYICYNQGLRYIEPGKVSIIATIEPVVAVVLAYVFFKELLEPVQLLGTVLVLTGVILIQLPVRKKISESTSTAAG
ncbi:DMT family transporter [Desulfolucanica intricata]|uniref:DMT family transporter n=1 Tax=Desulfolucanica intricata TaxID=1285191 RepID=UPI00082D96DB|nr:EamA family transporter [Desulfolucanica intricata]